MLDVLILIPDGHSLIHHGKLLEVEGPLTASGGGFPECRDVYGLVHIGSSPTRA
jgi:hypothetical protein